MASIYTFNNKYQLLPSSPNKSMSSISSSENGIRHNNQRIPYLKIFFVDIKVFFGTVFQLKTLQAVAVILYVKGF